MVSLLKQAHPGPGVIYELGCGWGGMARKLARHFPNHRIEAVEISPLVAAWAKLLAWRYANLNVRRGDMLTTRLDGAAAVVCYLMIEATQSLAVSLDEQLPTGTPVVSVVFGFRGRQSAAQCRPRGWQPGIVQLYSWPAVSDS